APMYTPCQSPCRCVLFELLRALPVPFFDFFFFNDPATTEIYTLSLHDALPISTSRTRSENESSRPSYLPVLQRSIRCREESRWRSEEHTSELQSLAYLVCRLLLEKKKQAQDHHTHPHRAGRGIVRRPCRAPRRR